MLFTVEAGNDSWHGMFQAFKLGRNYALLFVIFRLFWDTLFRLRKMILLTLMVVGTCSSEIFFKCAVEQHCQMLRLYGPGDRWMNE
jgi:hypothetical protein